MNSPIIAKIVDIKPDGATFLVPISDWSKFAHQEISEIEVLLRDGRALTPKQSRAINAIIGNIADHSQGGVQLETAREYGLTWLYDTSADSIRRKIKLHWADLVNIYPFSLSPKSEDCLTESVANAFIEWLIDTCIKLDVRVDTRMLDDPATMRYVYACLLERRCCICGKYADFHHCGLHNDQPSSHVGMGRNRKEVCHIGLLGLPLCREHHGLTHDKGDQWLLDLYKLIPIQADERIAKANNLNTKEKNT